jgi:TolB-like protein/class 3 adenylate cyclase
VLKLLSGKEETPDMAETRKLTTILAADVAGYSRLTATDEEGTVARLRALRHELIDPLIRGSHGRTFKTTGDGILIEFPSVVDAVRCSVEVQRGMMMRNVNVPTDSRIEVRVGIHLGDVIVDRDGDLFGDGVNIAARLEGICQPGAVCLSSAAYEQVRDKVSAEFVDLGERELKNIPRPIHAYAVIISSLDKPSRTDAGAARSSAAPRLSIVVLPFANIGGDPEQDYFVDGVTESLTTDLSRISGSFVIARNTAFTYKAKSFDVKQIGRDLNVRYVLEGSVQRGGNRLRVNVQLIDAESGAHLWAERFDKPVADLFDMQDEIVARLANTLNAQLIAAEARRAETVSVPDAIDYCFRGRATLNRGESLTIVRESQALFDEALRLDPSNVEALVGAARSLTTAVFGNMTDDPTSHLDKAENLLRRALSIMPEHAMAHALLGGIHARRGRIDDDIAECEQAIRLDPNLPFAYLTLSVANLYLDRPEECLNHLDEAIRRSPRDPLFYIFHYVTGGALVSLGRFEEAIAAYRRSIDTNRMHPAPYFYMGAVHWHLGRHAEAKRWIDEGLALDPTFNVRRVLSIMPKEMAKKRAPILDAMRQAGVPNG